MMCSTRLALAALTFALAWGLGSDARGKVSEVITDLYGGNGITLTAGFHVGHFTIAANPQAAAQLEALNEGIRESLQSFAFNSSVSSFTFDPALAVFLPSVDSFGTIVADRADTIGKGKLIMGMSYTKLDYKRFDGDDLDDLSVSFVHEDCCPTDGMLTGFETDFIQVDIDLDFEQDVLAYFGTFGLTDDADLTLIVPIVKSSQRVKAAASVVEVGGLPGTHAFGATETSIDSVRDESTGFGDVVMRTKYNFLKGHATLPDMSVLARIKFQSGDDDELLGTGQTTFGGRYIASKVYGTFTPHLNLGYEFNSEGSDFYNLKYAAGFDMVVPGTEDVGLAMDVFGKYQPNAPNGIGESIIDFSIGTRFNPFDSLLVTANAILPLNRNEGLRTVVTWTLGVEYTFR